MKRSAAGAIAWSPVGITAYFGSAEISKVAALAKMPPPVAGGYRREVGRHDLSVDRVDGQTVLYCSYDLRSH